MQLACLTMIYKRFSFETALEHIAQAGYRHVVIWNRHEDKDILEEAGAVERIRDGLRQYGLQPVMLFAHTQFKHDQPPERAPPQWQGRRSRFARPVRPPVAAVGRPALPGAGTVRPDGRRTAGR